MRLRLRLALLMGMCARNSAPCTACLRTASSRRVTCAKRRAVRPRAARSCALRLQQRIRQNIHQNIGTRVAETVRHLFANKDDLLQRYLTLIAELPTARRHLSRSLVHNDSALEIMLCL